MTGERIDHPVAAIVVRGGVPRSIRITTAELRVPS
jgi:hypothetical protein